MSPIIRKIATMENNYNENFNFESKKSVNEVGKWNQ
jgi:hypothetical protein